MKKRLLFFVMLLVAAILATTGCSADVTVNDPSKNGPEDPDPSSTGGIHIDVDFNLNINAEEGKDADGFTWENNFSEITITGYIGASNELTVPNTINGKPVTQIKDGAFKNFTGLKSIVIPGSVKSIVGVFEGCTGLETVVIAEQGLENMSRAFDRCSSLKTINIPSTVKYMAGAFDSCTALESDIAVPEGVASLSSTFRHCESLKKVTVPQSVTNLYSAFEGCTALEEANIPAGVTDLRYAFEDCTSLKSIQIPEGITELECTFRGCSALESVVLPEGLTKMERAFAGCTSLQEICIPSSMTWRTEHAFLNCTALERVTFADLEKTEALDEATFNGCTSLKTLELPEGMRFDGYGCIALEKLTIHVPDNRDLYEEEDGDNYIRVDLTTYVTFSNLPSLKTLNFVSDVDDAQIYIYGFSTDYESSYTEFTGSASWYETLLNEAYLALENGYRYYDEILADGTEARWISTYDEDKSWTADEISTTKIESNARVGNQIIYTCYVPALIGEDLTPGVICHKSVETEYLWCYRRETSDSVSGAEAYADCAYSESITINGVTYPVTLYEASYN